jgi:uncharacterized protein (DUF427 family)
MSLLKHTDHHTHCPYKGDASSASSQMTAAPKMQCGSYEKPFPAGGEIKEYLAFYPTRGNLNSVQSWTLEEFRPVR